ncbi:hypothetical protein R6Q57_005523 [Mikania cordata]
MEVKEKKWCSILPSFYFSTQTLFSDPIPVASPAPSFPSPLHPQNCRWSSSPPPVVGRFHLLSSSSPLPVPIAAQHSFLLSATADRALIRNRQLDPHFIEVPLSSSEGLKAFFERVGVAIVVIEIC